MRYGASMTAYKRRDHHKSGGFRNPPDHYFPDRRFSRVGRWEYWSFMLRRVVKASKPPPVPVDHVIAEDLALAGLVAHQGADSITWLGHAAFLLRLQGVTVLLDPYLGARASPVGIMGPKRFVPPAIAPERLPPIDVMAVSHNHYDHLCVPTLARLNGGERTTAIVPLGLKRYFLNRPWASVHEVDWGDSVRVGEVTMTAMPALHWSRRGMWDVNRTLWVSYVIASPQLKIYFTGDTGYGPMFQRIGESHGPFDLALVPIGSYQPASIMRRHHTTPEEAVNIGRDAGARAMVGMHWGTVILTDEPPFEPPERFRAAAALAGYAPENAWVMRIGETRALKPWPGN